MHRESYRLFHQMTEQLSGVDEPRERLIEGMVSSLRNVRESPALSSWFATAQRPIGAEIAEQSQVIKALTEAFLISMAPDDPEVVERKARWLVRVMTSLLVFPGHDEADERAMIEQFVVADGGADATDGIAGAAARTVSRPMLQASLMPLQRIMSSATATCTLFSPSGRGNSCSARESRRSNVFRWV